MLAQFLRYIDGVSFFIIFLVYFVEKKFFFFFWNISLNTFFHIFCLNIYYKYFLTFFLVGKLFFLNFAV